MSEEGQIIQDPIKWWAGWTAFWGVTYLAFSYFAGYFYSRSEIMLGYLVFFFFTTSGGYLLRQWELEKGRLNVERELQKQIEHPRYIPSHVKREVWRRDQGKCVECGSQNRLEYDHIIPVSKGGSNTARNVQLLCEQCNRSKGAKIA